MPETRVMDASGQPAQGRLKHPGFKPGALIMFLPRESDGKLVLGGLKLVDAGAQGTIDRIRQPPPKIDLSNVKPLTDMAPDERYKGFQGGLYPDGQNERPAQHTAVGIALAKQIVPVNKEGKPQADGRVVLLTIGMSNTMQASSGLLRMAKLEKDLNPRLTIVNGALGGMVANRIQDVEGGRSYDNGRYIKYWPYVDEQLETAGVTRVQVQAVWLKQADPGPTLPFPDHAKLLQQEQVKIAHILHDRFPNLKLAYVSSRIYGGWAKTSLNPEPYAYESNFAAKWLIEQQIKGDAELNFDPSKGAVKAPWLSWGPYLWANGTTPRKDGFFYVEDDLRADDRTHESEQGQNKVGRELIKFFKADPSSREWFTRSDGGARSNSGGNVHVPQTPRGQPESPRVGPGEGGGDGLAGDWPQFRGSNSGIADEEKLPGEWSEEKHLAWKVHVPGYGWSSPIVWRDKVFVTSAVANNQKPPPRKGPGGGPKVPPDEVYRFEVHCLDAVTGKTLWKQVAAERKPPIPTHITNTYASETPVTDGERLYVCFGMIGVFCYDLSGTLLWTKDLGAYRMFGNWGTGSSPALAGTRLFVQCDNEEKSFLVALDAKSGAELWRVSRPERSTWSSPVVWRNQVRTELVLMGTRRIRSYDPATGKVYWELTTLEGSGAATGKGAGGCKSTPVAMPEMIYVGMASKTEGQQLGPLWAVKAGAAGDISLNGAEKSNAHIAWFRPDAGPHFASAVVYDNLLYVFPPHDGMLRCFDAETGADIYKQRLPGAGDFTASPWVQGGRICNIDANGSTFVVGAGRAYKLLGKNELNDRFWASPAPARGAVFLRGVEYLYCVR